VSRQRIERVDDIPLILYWLKKMRVQEIIDAIWLPHTNWQGLSYGQLAVLFLTYVVHCRTHHLSGMEDWVVQHRTVLREATGWSIAVKEATDDRLGRLLEVLGEREDQGIAFQHQLGQHLIQAYALPTEVGRFDTSTFNVHHASSQAGEPGKGVLSFGHSKDRRPDLLQFKQGLGTLDPSGVPLLTTTVSGKAADDPLYVPAWREMVRTIGHREFLYVADCKAAALATRTTIDHEGGHYLFPLPMTGEIPQQLRTFVMNPPQAPVPICLETETDERDKKRNKKRVVGRGFTIEKEMTADLEDATAHTWTERWLITQSTAHAKRQQEALLARMHDAEEELSRLRVKKDERAPDVQTRAAQILKRRKVADFITIEAQEITTSDKQYIGPGRPGPNRPYKRVEKRHAQLSYQRNQTALKEALQLAGWRIYVTNLPTARMSLDQAMDFYRDEWLLERGFHRFKKGSLPVLPLFVRVPERIKGLMILLMVALQVLTLLEFVARRQLADQDECLTGLMPGNPKRKTTRPSAERILAQFIGLHLLIEETETQITGHLVEPLSPLQRRLLALLDIPETVYDLTLNQQVIKFHDAAWLTDKTMLRCIGDFEYKTGFCTLLMLFSRCHGGFRVEFWR